MFKFLRKLDVLPGAKTQTTAVLYALFGVLRVFGVVDLTPDQASAINGLVGAALVLFLALKVQRSADEG